jgi:uncharacterized protein YciI
MRVEIAMMHYLLFYDVVEDYVQKRIPFRAAHLAHGAKSVERGELVLGGALADPVDASILLFRVPSKEVVEQFAKSDPYVTSGLVKRWWVREWTTVIGEGAALKVTL